LTSMQVEDMVELNASIVEMDSTWGKFVESITAKLAPSVTKIVEELTTVITALDNHYKDTTDFGGTKLKPIDSKIQMAQDFGLPVGDAAGGAQTIDELKNMPGQIDLMKFFRGEQPEGEFDFATTLRTGGLQIA